MLEKKGCREASHHDDRDRTTSLRWENPAEIYVPGFLNNRQLNPVYVEVRMPINIGRHRNTDLYAHLQTCKCESVQVCTPAEYQH